MSIQNYLSHPYAAPEGVSEFSAYPHSAQNPEVLGVLASHHEEQAQHHRVLGQQFYQDPSLRGDASERAAFSSFAQSRGHAEAASILRGLL